MPEEHVSVPLLLKLQTCLKLGGLCSVVLTSSVLWLDSTKFLILGTETSAPSQYLQEKQDWVALVSQPNWFEVDWSWGWLKLRLIEVEVDWSWGWLELRLIEVEVDWS